MLAIAGGKGGVGKTTTALGIAAALPGQPLVVDTDRDMPDLHALAEVNREPMLDTVVGDQTGSSTPAAAATGDNDRGMNVPINESATGAPINDGETGASTSGRTAPATTDSNESLGQSCPAHGCRVLPAPSGDAPRTDRLLNRLAAKHSAEDGAESPILVDTPAGVSVDAAAPLQAVDGVLLVSTACAPALRDAAKTASMARAVGTPVVGVLLTRAIARPPGTEDLLDCSVVGCIPSAPTRPLESHRVQERYVAATSRLRETASAEIL